MDVEIDHVTGRAVVKSPKHKEDFLVYKARDNTPFFSIKFGNGKVRLPAMLEGKYTTIPKAIQTIRNYIASAEETFAAKSEALASYRNASKSRPENS